MSFYSKPFRATSSLEAIKADIHPGELVELIDPDGGPSSFFICDRNGHLFKIPFTLITND